MIDARSYEEKVIAPSIVVTGDEDVSLVNSISNPLIRNCATKALELKRSLGDGEAYVSQITTDIIADLLAFDNHMKVRPYDQVVHSIRKISSLTEAEKAAAEVKTAVDEALQTVVDRLEEQHKLEEAHRDEEQFQIMVTGHRDIIGEIYNSVVRRLTTIIKQYKISKSNVVGVVGGAAGGDQALGDACVETESPFRLFLPNWAYEQWYEQQKQLEGLRLSKFYIGSHFSVERPMEANWRKLWKTERWWTDNFKRNEDMVDVASCHIVVSRIHPNLVLNDRNSKGGTAACIKTMYKAGKRRIIWVDASVPDDTAFGWVNLTKT